MTVVTEKRLYETPDGELVEELEDSGSLFCGVGAELTDEAAERYEAYVAAAEEPGARSQEPEAAKAAKKPANKAATKSQNKGA